ncbi:DNA sulfur modification protein DndB [Bacillaceae bacterium Marseille-Q3522]|nr:DNA sulfur modification protein DndB [Bacillaceae bacterium Marseille-Q3522]
MSINTINSINLGTPTNAIQIPALKYISGGRIWYAATIPYRTLGKFIKTSAVKKKNQEIIRKDIKNRFLDTKHKKEIVQYLKSEKEFTLPPITLVSYEELDFRPYEFADGKLDEDIILNNGGSVVGVILLPIDYEFECLDGNHRTAAIQDLTNENPEYIVGSSMLLNIVHEKRPKKIRQDFVDVNKNVKQTTSSINTLFNTRDPLSNLVVDLVDETDYLKETTELLATSVSKLSKDIYTINNIKNAIIEIAGYNSQSGKASKLAQELIESPDKEKELRKKANLFFNELKKTKVISMCLKHRENTAEIRNSSVITTGTGIIVASRIAGYIFTNFNEYQYQEKIQKLFSLDWSRNNSIFEGKIMVNQKILNSREAISSTVVALKVQLDFKLLENEYHFIE